MKLRFKEPLTLLVAALAVVACSPDSSDSPVSPPLGQAITKAGGITVEVCKVPIREDDATIDLDAAGEYDFTYEIDGGGEVNFSQVSVEEFPSNPATELTDCVSTTYKIPVPMDADELVITELTEQFGDGYAELWRIATTGNQGCTATPTYVNDGTTAGYVTIDFTAGDCGQNMKVFFKNRFIPEPPGGGEGCTPGYWRQEQHYDSWSGYTPGQYFDDVFGAGPHITLGEAVQLGGGGENALIRHAVAALLNASSPDVDYAYSAADIIAWTAAALTSGEGIEDLKDDFDEANNAGCDLN